MIRHPFCHTSIGLLAVAAVVAFACGTHVDAEPAPLQSNVAKKDARAGDSQNLGQLLAAAGKGDPKAQLHIGLMYLVGDGVDRDADEAATWLRRAAEQGDASAQFNLADMYWEGIRVSGNVEEAFRLFRRLAEQGHAFAQFNVATLYQQGLDVEQDLQEAARWYREAATQGVVNAAYRLGWMYAHGNGVPQDYVEAHKWLNIATGRAFADEQQRHAQVRDDVAKEMTAAQIAEAEARAREWLILFESKNTCKDTRTRFRASLTFDAKGIEFGPWIRQFVDQLNRNWVNPPCSSLEGRAIYTLQVAKDGRTSRLDLRARSAFPECEEAVFRTFARWNPIPLPASYPAESVQLVVTFFFNETPL
jgi:hypothetical protein